MQKALPGIYPRNKCTKFQPNRTMFDASSLPQSLSLVLAKRTRPQAIKIKIFKKWIKALPVIYQRNKCTKFQLNRTSFEAWCRLPQSFWADTQQTDRHRQTFSDYSSSENIKNVTWTSKQRLVFSSLRGKMLYTCYILMNGCRRKIRLMRLKRLSGKGPLLRFAKVKNKNVAQTKKPEWKAAFTFTF